MTDTPGLQAHARNDKWTPSRRGPACGLLRAQSLGCKQPLDHNGAHGRRFFGFERLAWPRHHIHTTRKKFWLARLQAAAEVTAITLSLRFKPCESTSLQAN